MNKKRLKSWAVCFVVISVIIGLNGCASSTGPAASTPRGTQKDTLSAEPITLSFFTNNPDRSVGQGKMEQTLIDEYTKLHPNIQIKVETLSPDYQYQDKIKIDNATDAMPDIIAAWGNTNFLTPLLNNHALAEISIEDLAGDNFIPAAFDGFKSNGKLYGIPRNSDFWILYYNKKIFTDFGLQLPRTEAELLDTIAKLKGKKMIPIAMDGRDAWISGILFDTLVERISGTWETTQNAMNRSGSFKDPAVIAAATTLQKWVKAGAFGDGFLNQDYGSARTLFGQGKAAMFMMGQWEMSMAGDANFSAEVRNNIGAIPIPSLENGKGSASDLPAWFGGGFAVSEKSKYKKEALDFLKWAFRPEGWAKGVWQNGIAFPSQKYDQFLTGNENKVQTDLMTIFDKAKSYSGTLSQDKFMPDSQKMFYDSVQNLEGFKITPEEFVRVIEIAAEQSLKTTQQAK
ncbi:MAG: hypothetical protein JWM44_4417 [Bacilli bacterium]|nr:hypothetical protein [Bacilli bacterium]